jgi:hypothetical protein
MAADRFTTPFPQAVLNSDVSFLHHLYTEEIGFFCICYFFYFYFYFLKYFSERIPFPFIRWIVGVCLGFNWGTDEERGLGRSFGTESGGGGGGGYDSSIRSSYMSKAFGSLFDSDSTVGQTLKSTVFESGPNKLKKNKVVPSFLLLNELFRLELLNMMSVEGVSFDKQNKTILPQLNEKENVNNNNAGDDKTFTFTRYIEKKKMLEQKKLEEEKRRKEEEEENFGWDYGDPSESGNLITTQDINRQALLKPVFKKSEHDVKKFKLKLVEFDLLEKKLKQFVNKNNLYTSEDQEFYQERMKWIVKSSSTDEVTLSPLPFQPLNDSTSTASLPSVFSSASIPIQSNMRAMRSITGVIGRTLPQKRKPQLFSSSFLLHNRMGKRSGFSRRDDIEREYEMMENSEVKTRPINVESLPMHLGREWLPPLSFIQDPPPPPDLLQMVSEMKKKFRQEEEEGEERVNKRKEEEKKKNEEEEKKMAEIDNLLNSLSGVNNNTSRPTSLSAPGRQGERRTSMFSRPNMDSKRKFITPGYETQMYGSDHAGVARFSPVPKRFLDLNKSMMIYIIATIIFLFI